MQIRLLSMQTKDNKRMFVDTILFTIIIYFIIQSISNLIMSVYMLELLNTSLDIKAAGLAFMFTSIGVLLIKSEFKGLKISGITLIVFRLLYPLFNTSIKLVLSGLATGSAFIFLPLLFLNNKGNRQFVNSLSLGFGFATLISIFSRTMGYSVDFTEYGSTQFIAWILGIMAIILLLRYEIKTEETKEAESGGIFLHILGFISVIGLIYFAYGSPGVFTRWSESNYTLTLAMSTLPLLGLIIIMLFKSDLLSSISKRILITWNFLFTMSLVIAISSNQVDFIDNYPSDTIIVGLSSAAMKFFMYLNLILSPVIFIDLMLIMKSMMSKNLSRKNLSLSFLGSAFILVVLIFILLFSNVWGYVEPVSLVFRGMMWLPYLILCLFIFIPVSLMKNIDFPEFTKSKFSIYFVLIFGLLVLGTITGGLLLSSNPAAADTSSITEVKIMTYNVQQGVNESGEFNFKAQLDLIREINPDIIGLQESDTAKINIGNNDVARYFADQLDYYSYGGPKVVMQTFGVVLLSRWPIKNPTSFYTYGNEDEIGSIHAQVEVNDITLNIFVNHPAGSNDSKNAHTEGMLELASGLSNVVLLGDFNWREDTAFYSMVTQTYTDTWREVYPTGIDNQGLNMSSTIDHIFVSDTFSVTDANYITSPASQTDHPVYWTDISW